MRQFQQQPLSKTNIADFPRGSRCDTVIADPPRNTPPYAPAPLTTPPKLLLTVEEAAQRLNIGRPKMYELVMRGEVLSIKIGASRRIPVAAVEEYVQRLCQTALAEVSARRERYGD